MLYHVTRNGQTYGPYTLEDLQKYVASGNVLPTDMAKSDDMAEAVSVAQLLGMAAPAMGAAPLATYAVASGEYPQTAALYPDPPNLHWALVLVIGLFTCGIFTFIWMFVQAAWVRKVNPNSKAIFYYIAAFVFDVIAIVAQLTMIFAGRNGSSTGTLSAVHFVCLLAYIVLFLAAIFTMRSDLEEHFNGPEPIGLSLSGVMTFFFSVLYFQYHMTRINELKRLARYRGAAI